MIVAGIDEAGYGPLLGPLVTALTSFRLAPDRPEDLWARLGCAVTNKAGADPDHRLPVIDSKELYRSGQSLAALETVALAFSGLAAGLGVPRDGAEFLCRHHREALLATANYPWYRQELPTLALPLAADPQRILQGTARLAEAADRGGTKVVCFSIRPLLAAAFNRHTRRFGSKAETLFHQNRLLMGDLLETASPHRILCDRHGGRRYYAPLLAAAFPGARVEVLREEKAHSSYRVSPTEPRRPPFEVAYRVNGEHHGLEVALASILAKYTREVLMAALNRFFARRLPRLKKTAGYTSDGRRFLRDLEEGQALAPGERALLVRCR